MSLLVPVKRNNTLTWPGFSDLERQLDRIFNHGDDVSSRATCDWVPAVDIHETDDAYILEADLPGITRKDIEVKVIEDRVSIRGTRKYASNKEDRGYWRRERAEGTFERSFRLQGGIDGSKVDAHFENGVLTVKLPKPEAIRPKQIEVKVK